MEWSLFLLGMLGALLVVYLGKRDVVPEFRPLFDTSEKEKEAGEHRDHIKKTEKDIDDMQAKLRDESISADLAQRLTTVLNSSLTELDVERRRLRRLERELTQSQVLSRTLGFALYIVLGGVFGSLLVGRVEVTGLTGELPKYFGSIIIGATWTSYLSVIGLSQVGKRIDERIEAAKKEIAEAASKEAEKTDFLLSADAVSRIAADKLDLTRATVRKDAKGLL